MFLFCLFARVAGAALRAVSLGPGLPIAGPRRQVAAWTRRPGACHPGLVGPSRALAGRCRVGAAHSEPPNRAARPVPCMGPQTETGSARLYCLRLLGCGQRVVSVSCLPPSPRPEFRAAPWMRVCGGAPSGSAWVSWALFALLALSPASCVLARSLKVAPTEPVKMRFCGSSPLGWEAGMRRGAAQ